ncbi:MAG: methionine--tRNA ligase subunit beta, partial [Pseudomonadota bacterium]
HPKFVQPEIRRNEILAFIRGGLRDLSISRTTFQWGIQAPSDPKHVIYVWVDALTNYVSALGGPGAKNYETFWPATLHLIGKDILRFHSVYWPTMLMSAGLPLPKQILAHGWWTVNGQKMSKSLRNVVEPNMLASDIGRDALRYFLVRETPLGNDGDFSHEGLINRINSELANDLGNLLNRSLAMAIKYCGGVVPAFAENLKTVDIDRELIELAYRCKDEAAAFFEDHAPSKAVESIWELVRGTNKYIDRSAPYKLIKEPSQKRRVEEVLANFLEALRWISMMADPVIPDKAAEIRKQLGFSEDELKHPKWPENWGELPTGLALKLGAPLFPRIDDEHKGILLTKWQQISPEEEEKDSKEKVDVKIDNQSIVNPFDSDRVRRQGASEEAPEQPCSALRSHRSEQRSIRDRDGLNGFTISFDEFSRVDLRVATVLEAQKVEGADRLLQLKVDLGNEQRQVVAGIAEAYSPDQLVGKQVIFVANLKPTKIRGLLSEGMLLAAGEKRVLALSALDREVPPGTKVS